MKFLDSYYTITRFQSLEAFGWLQSTVGTGNWSFVGIGRSSTLCKVSIINCRFSGAYHRLAKSTPSPCLASRMTGNPMLAQQRGVP